MEALTRPFTRKGDAMTDLSNLERRVANLETQIEIQSLILGAAVAIAPDPQPLLAYLKGFAEQHDAHALYSTSLSDDQLRRVQAGMLAYIETLSRRLA